MLRAARQQQGLHIAALAAAIKVTPAKLEALEAGRIEALPDATFARAREVVGSDQAMFELIGVTAAYNMVSRILVATTLTP